MKYEHLEQYVLSYALYKTSALIRIQDEHIAYEPHVNLFKIIREIYATTAKNEITRTEIVTYIDREWGKAGFTEYTMDLCFDLKENYIKYKTEEKAKLEFSESISMLNERWKINDMLMEIATAEQHIRDGRMVEGIATLKNIRLNSVKETESTSSVIMDSIDKTNGLKSGISVIDEKLGGWLKGNIMTLYGDTGCLKTQSSLWLAMKTLEANPNAKAIFFEKEMHKKDLGRRMMSMLTNIGGDVLVKAHKDNNDEKLEEIRLATKYKLDEKKEIMDRLIIVSEGEFESAYDMYEYVDSIRPDIIILDYVTLLGEGRKHSRNKMKARDESYFLWLGSQLDIIRNMTIENGLFTVMISQLNHKALTARLVKIPSIDDIEFGTKVKQISSYIYSVFWPWKYRDKSGINIKTNKYFYLLNQKNRHGADGLDIMLEAKPEYNIFKEPDFLVANEMNAWINTYRNKG